MTIQMKDTAAGLIRVSDISQVEGHSLDAQERLIKELCANRGWDLVRIYREEGKSAHVDSISKRPDFKRLLDDAKLGKFDVVVVHTLDRWARNLKVLLESVAILDQCGVGLVSITENLDWSTAEGRLVARTLGSFSEFFSDKLGTHIKKGVSERAHQGRHLGGVPFGYESCYEKGQLWCEVEHPGGIHNITKEGQAIVHLFQQCSSGTVALSELASWMNNEKFRTRNTKKLPDRNGGATAGPKLFTTASVRGILHNPFYTGKVRHRDQLLPGAHEGLVSEDLFQAVQLALKKNSGRSETLHAHPEREYLLKGLVRCAHCLMPLWAQTLNSGSRLYREQASWRSHAECPADGKSIRCDIPDDQIGNIVSALVLPDAWMDRVLAQVHLADDVKKVAHETKETEQRLKRLGQVYLDNLVTTEEYHRQKRQLEDKLASLVVPGFDATAEAGKLLEVLPRLWDEANLTERRKLLLTLLDAIYVDTVHEKSIVAIRPKPAFRPLFEVATTRQGSDVVLVLEKDLPPVENPGADTVPCFWWRRGRLHIPQLQTSPVIIPHRVPRSWAAYPVAWAA